MVSCEWMQEMLILNFQRSARAHNTQRASAYGAKSPELEVRRGVAQAAARAGDVALSGGIIPGPTEARAPVDCFRLANDLRCAIA